MTKDIIIKKEEEEEERENRSANKVVIEMAGS